MSIDKMCACYLLSCNSTTQFIFVNVKAPFIAVLNEVIEKTTFFLNFCRKMHELSLNIANKSYVRPPRVMSRKQTLLWAYLA